MSSRNLCFQELMIANKNSDINIELNIYIYICIYLKNFDIAASNTKILLFLITKLVQKGSVGTAL